MTRDVSLEFLYHYYPLRLDGAHRDQDLARVVMVLTSNEIYFSSVKDFNDPFDCRPIYVGHEKDFFPWIDQVRNDGRFPPAMWDAVKQKWLRGDVTMDQVCVGLGEGLFNKISQNNGIYCLSRDCNNILMWSHYASSHSGVCIQFLGEPGNEFFGAAQQVHYQEEMPIVDIFLRDFEKVVNSTFLTKNINWKYENEFRIVSNRMKPGIHRFPRRLIKGLILGGKIDAQQEQTLKVVISKVPGIVLYKASLNPRKYLMDINQLGE